MLRRMRSGAVRPADVGLDHMPYEGEKLSSPIIEFTTKLEEVDRFIAADEAQRVSRPSEEQSAEMIDITAAGQRCDLPAGRGRRGCGMPTAESRTRV